MLDVCVKPSICFRSFRRHRLFPLMALVTFLMAYYIFPSVKHFPNTVLKLILRSHSFLLCYLSNYLREIIKTDILWPVLFSFDPFRSKILVLRSGPQINTKVAFHTTTTVNLLTSSSNSGKLKVGTQLYQSKSNQTTKQHQIKPCQAIVVHLNH